jgi:hypothetical protein
MVLEVFPMTKSNETKTEVKAKAVTVCFCGCGAFTKGGKFNPGHDAKLKSLLTSILAGEQPNSVIAEVTRTHKSDIGFLQGKGNRFARAFSATTRTKSVGGAK